MDPLTGDTLNQDSLLKAVQETLDVTNTLVLFAADPGAQSYEPKVTVAVTPPCVTETVLVMPPPVTVMVALRLDAFVFSVAVMTILPLLYPLAGDTLNQDVLLLVALQETLEVTETPMLFAADPGDQVEEPK